MVTTTVRPSSVCRDPRQSQRVIPAVSPQHGPDSVDWRSGQADKRRDPRLSGHFFYICLQLLKWQLRLGRRGRIPPDIILGNLVKQSGGMGPPVPRSCLSSLPVNVDTDCDQIQWKERTSWSLVYGHITQPTSCDPATRAATPQNDIIWGSDWETIQAAIKLLMTL